MSMPDQEKEKASAVAVPAEAPAAPPPPTAPAKSVATTEEAGSQYFFGEPLVGFDPSEITGSLIVIEGMDGSGRSTQIALLQEWLESLRFEPFLQQRNLRRPPGAVHAFDDDQAAGDFARIKSDQRLAEKILRASLFRCSGGFRRSRRRRRRSRRFRRDSHGGSFLFFLVRHAHSDSAMRGAKRLRSIFSATMSRICFWSLFTGSVPSSTTKLSESTILSYSSRILAWNSRKLSARSYDIPRSMPAS